MKKFKLILASLLLLPAISFAVCNPFTPNTVLTASALNNAISAPCITSGTITGSTINNTPIGAVTKSTGAFSALEADSFSVSGLFSLAVGSDVASAATIDLTAATGNTVAITGTTATSAFTMNEGQHITMVAAGAWPITYNATTAKIIGGIDYTCTAGEVVQAFKANGVVFVYPEDIVLASGHYGQSWQAFTSGTRAIATNYTNTTGKPIQVNATVYRAGVDSPADLVVDGVVASSGYAATGAWATLSAIVPPGSVYYVTGTNITWGAWAELR